VIDKRYDKYREWALKFMCEAPEEVCGPAGWPMTATGPDLEKRRELTYQYRQTKASALWWTAVPIP
jgi:hypothetical protein